MAQIDYKITIEYVWLREKTNLEKCFHCEETIYSDVYRLFLIHPGQNGKIRYKEDKTDVCLCESCNNAVNGL